MIEKWKLVLLIVGCTSFLFLIYFPIDFFLYRRRKRMARERQTLSACRSSPVRAAQYHAKVTPNVSAETDYGELDEIEQRKYRAQRGVIRFLRMLKMKKSSAEMIEKGGLTETASSAKSPSPSPRVNIIPDPEKAPSVNGSVQFMNEYELNSSWKSNYNSYDDDYLDYTPERKITNTSKRWNENQDVYTVKRKKSHLGVKFDKKMSKFAVYQQKNITSPPGTSRVKKKTGPSGMGPLENTTDFLVESFDKERFNNSVRSSNDEYFDTGNKENPTDKLSNISKIHQEVISDTNNLSSAKMSEDASDSTASGVDNNSEDMKESTSTFANDDTASMFQTNFDIRSEPFARYKKLNHTQSELCMVRKPKFSHKNGRKRNVISPLCSDETFMEQMNLEESSSSDKSMPISIPIFAEYSETQNVRRKKKKKSILKNECSGSMPDLFYKSETYISTNE